MIPCTLIDGRNAILYDVHSIAEAEEMIRSDREDSPRIAVEVYTFSDDAIHSIRAGDISTLRDMDERITRDTSPAPST
jgi:hypothetical protein